MSTNNARRLLPRRFVSGCFLAILGIACAATEDQAAAAETEKPTGPWDVETLQQVPETTWGAIKGLVQEVYYASEPYEGKPTRVFAYYGRPEGSGPFPAVLLVHGGGGKAFADWADHWAKRGYVALAMDLSGNGPNTNDSQDPAGRLKDGGPREDDLFIFRDFTDNDIRDMWTYHAVAAVLRGHALLASREEVDARRVAVTGISWGGYLTCILAGLDDQLKAAVPVYGCGFLHENSFWVEPQFSKMTDVRRQRWVENFDPSRYLGRAKCPMLFVDGTCDFAYPLDSLQKSYNLVKTPVTLSVKINRPHGHIWTFPEVDAFIDSCLKDGQPLPTISAMTTANGTVSARVTSLVPMVNAELDYTTDTGPWQDRKWKTIPAEIKGNSVTATLPSKGSLVYYLYVTDQRGLAVSTPHAELKPETRPPHPQNGR
jgi:dienelactone hydrolase